MLKNAYSHLNLSRFEDTKGAVWNLKSKKDRQHNGKTKDKRTNNDLQNTTEKTKDDQHELYKKLMCARVNSSFSH